MTEIFILLALEGSIITFFGLLLGFVIYLLTVLSLSEISNTYFGITLRLQILSQTEWTILGGILFSGMIASLIPGLRAYQLSLSDGLSPRI